MLKRILYLGMNSRKKKIQISILYFKRRARDTVRLLRRRFSGGKKGKYDFILCDITL